MVTEKPARRSQAVRRAGTRAKLVAAARHLFATGGYAETATPDVVKRAGVTRGALYHHFDDKRDLFHAVAQEEARAVAEQIEQQATQETDPQRAMTAGLDAFFAAMAEPGRVRILLEEAPAVLGHVAAMELTRASGTDELREGLSDVLPNMDAQDIDALASLLSAAFDRAALDIAHGGDPARYRKSMLRLVEQTLAPQGGAT